MEKINWEEEFDKEFESIFNEIGGFGTYKDIKSFICQLLSQRDEELVKEISNLFLCKKCRECNEKILSKLGLF